MECKFCGKKISFADWLFCRRSCVNHWMGYYELPKIDRFIAQPKNMIKFKKWIQVKNKEVELNG